MYYHIQVTTDKNEEIHLFDTTDLSFIKDEIIVPHLSGKDYQLNGFFIIPSKVKRIVVTESDNDSTESVNISYSDLDFSQTRGILPQECMFDNEKFSKDITQELFEKVETDLRENIKQHVPSVLELDTKIKNCLIQISELENSFSNLRNISKNMLDEKAARKFRIHNYILIGIILLYYGGIIGCVSWFDWDDIEPITYVLSISGVAAGLVYLFAREKTFNITIYLKAKKDKTYSKVYENYGFLKASDTPIQNQTIEK